MLKDEYVKQLKEMGNFLRECREEKARSLKDVADTTRISIGTIVDLENGDYKKFPSLVFIRGFLRNYALLLNIENDKINEMVTLLNHVYSSLGNNIDVKNDSNERPTIDMLDGGKKNYALILLLLFCLIVIIGLGTYFLINMPKSKNAVVISALVEEKIQEPAEKIIAENENITQFPTIQPKKLHLEFIIKEDGWLRISGDQEAPVEVYLREGESYFAEAVEKFVVTMTTEKMADLILNGKTIEHNFSNQNSLLAFELKKDSIHLLSN